MTASAAGRERRYRRLLWAYPGAYRRRHGAEIVTTLLEMAEAGHDRPAAAEALHLVACGLRQRFRLPAGRPLVVVAAVLAVLALDAAGAGGGTWLGWQTATPVPSDDGIRTLTSAMAGTPEVNVFPWESAMGGPVVGTTATGRGTFSAERIKDGLTSAGWQITTFTEWSGRTGVISTDPWVGVPTRFARFTATKGGLSLQGDGSMMAGGAEYGIDGQMGQRLDVWATDSAAVRPMAVAGVLLGGLAGWLLTAALADRARRNGRGSRRAVTALAATTFATAVVPAFELYRHLYRVLSYDSGAPTPYVVDSPADQLPTGLVPACTAVGLLALAATVLLTVRGARVGPDATGPEPVASS